MPAFSDRRRLRIYQLKTAGSEVIADIAADIWQDEEGKIRTSGLWDGLLPMSTEDIEIQARKQSISPLEWMRKRLLLCSVVRMEVVE